MHGGLRVALRGSAVVLACATSLTGGVTSAPASADVVPAPGSLDPGFDGDGRVLTQLSSTDQAHATVVQPDGHIVVAGFSEQGATGRDFTVLRYRPDGSLDSAFGNGGWATATFGSGPSRDEAYAVTLQPDGGIVVGGETWVEGTTVHHAAVARFRSDGTLDPAFAGDGTVVVPMGTKSTVRGVAVRPDGRIVLGGGMTNLSGGVGTWVGLAQLTNDGALDHAFAGNGVVMTPLGNSSVAHALMLQPGGSIVLAGRINAGGTTYMLVLRYLPHGAIDTSFGNGGNVQTQVGFASVNVATALARTADGGIVVGGFANVSGFQMVALRYRNGGDLDPAFSGDGIVTHASGGLGQAFGVAVDSAGRTLVAGDVGGVGFADVGLLRYQADGVLDPTFGTGGVVTTDLGDARNHGRALAIQQDERIVVAGYNTGSAVDGFNVLRYHGDVRTHVLTVATSGTGAGLVTSDPAGIDCGAVCGDDYDPGATVTLTASPAPGSVFAGWSGDCTGTATCAVTMDGPRSVTATFDLDTTPPETTITSAPPAVITDPAATFEFTADESGATFDCAVDGATPAPCTSPHTTAALANGVHTFAVSATDAAGNRDGTPATVAFRVCAGPNEEAARAIDDVLRRIDVERAERVLDRLCRPPR